ncbi:MAG: cysteine desulfurase family protein [Flavobacteriales bacterium]|jgi:cysteine desulfurase|nr:cysteine desulfurase family protein [Flavobacteriales bacterium]
MRVYLDNAATTPIASEVVDLMSEIMKSDYANPSSIHHGGRRSRIIIETSRKTVANLLNTSPGNIFFTSGGTEADNMAIRCGILDNNITHAVTSLISHKAVLYPLEELKDKKKISLSYVKLDETGRIDLNNLEEILKSNERTFVSIMHANNEIGTIQPIQEIGFLCKKYDAIFHSDTIQTMAHYPIDLQELDVDFITGSAHKFHGPKGVGFIYINDSVTICPLISGGSQERNMRAGTENVHSIAGLAKAMELSYSCMEKDKEYILGLKIYMIDKLRKNIKDVSFNAGCADLENSLFKILSVSFPKTSSSEMLLFSLDIMGISCSGGSACSAGNMSGSHVLDVVCKDHKRTGVRFSFSKYNTKKEIDYTINKLKEIFN